MALKITKLDIVSVGKERDLSAENLNPQQILPDDEIYTLHGSKGIAGSIRVKEVKYLSEENAVRIRFSREITGWNLDSGIGTIFKQRYFSRDHSGDGAFSLAGESTEGISMIFKRGTVYTFELVDPFRQPRAKITIET